MIYIILLIFIILLIYVFLTYNNLVRSKNYVKEGFSTMDVYLTKRWDLIPNLVEVVKTYAKHENTTFENVAGVRSGSYNNLSINQKVNVNEKLNHTLSNILAVAENYPELKANQNFLDLSKNLQQIENDIENSRKYYNGCVRIYNTSLQTFPSNIVARLFNFMPYDMFQAEEDAKNNVDIKVSDQ